MGRNPEQRYQRFVATVLASFVVTVVSCVLILRTSEPKVIRIYDDGRLPYNDLMVVSWDGLRWKTTDAKFAPSQGEFPDEIINLSVKLDPPSHPAKH